MAPRIQRSACSSSATATPYESGRGAPRANDAETVPRSLSDTQGDDAMKHLVKHLWTSHLGRLVLLTMPLLLAVAAPVRAQHVVTTNEMYPITGLYQYTPSAPCSCSGPSDAVNLRGVLHMMVQAQ